jgi:hypothetical protein
VVPPLADLRFVGVPGADLDRAQTCTEAEVVARHVVSVSFSYFDVFDSPVVNANSAVLKASITRIVYDIVLERDHDGTTLQEQLTGSVAIRNP